MELDDAYRVIGSTGPLNVGLYHILLYALLIFYNCWLIGFQLMGMIFIGHVPKNYHCTPPSGFLPNQTTPLVQSEGMEMEKCHMYEVHDGIVSGNTTECLYGWDYERIIGETSIVTDFDLVCSNGVYAKIGQSIFMAGVLVGSVTSGQLSDFFGRKIVLHVALVLKAISGIVMAQVWSYTALVVAWFFVGVFNQAVQISAYVMVTEMFPPEKRTLAMPLLSLLWGVAVSTVVPVALLFPNWRHYQIFISAICLIGIPLWWITPESARWLISRGRYKEAEVILQKMAKFNGIKSPKTFLKEDEGYPLSNIDQGDIDTKNINEKNTKETEIADDHQVTRRSLLDLFRAPVLLRILVIMMFCWFTNSIIYYGLSLNSVRLSGNKYLNVFFTCMIELPSGIFMIVILIWIGRRTALGVSLFFAGVCCVMIGCLPETSDALVGISTMGKFCVSFSFSMVFIYLPEIMPTPVRNVSMGACVLFARVGGIIAPFIIYLSDINRYLPFNILGAAAIVCACMCQMLPESRNKPLPETIEDGIQRGRSNLFSTWYKKYHDRHGVRI